MSNNNRWFYIFIIVRYVFIILFYSRFVFIFIIGEFYRFGRNDFCFFVIIWEIYVVSDGGFGLVGNVVIIWVKVILKFCYYRIFCWFFIDNRNFIIYILMENFFELFLIEIFLYNFYFFYFYRNFFLNLFFIVKIIGLIVFIYINEIDNLFYLSLFELIFVFLEFFIFFVFFRKFLSMIFSFGTKFFIFVTVFIGILGIVDFGFKEVVEFFYKI